MKLSHLFALRATLLARKDTTLHKSHGTRVAACKPRPKNSI
jgi:hypothetical protein